MSQIAMLKDAELLNKSEMARRLGMMISIITTNQPFNKWGEVLSDLIIANAILDRLIHHSHID